jgi:hypothetical protein
LGQDIQHGPQTSGAPKCSDSPLDRDGDGWRT